jgi:hypothetical protein
VPQTGTPAKARSSSSVGPAVKPDHTDHGDQPRAEPVLTSASRKNLFTAITTHRLDATDSLSLVHHQNRKIFELDLLQYLEAEHFHKRKRQWFQQAKTVQTEELDLNATLEKTKFRRTVNL